MVELKCDECGITVVGSSFKEVEMALKMHKQRLHSKEEKETITITMDETFSRQTDVEVSKEMFERLQSEDRKTKDQAIDELLDMFDEIWKDKKMEEDDLEWIDTHISDESREWSYDIG